MTGAVGPAISPTRRKMSVHLARRRGGDVALGEAPGRVAHGGLGPLEAALGGGDHLGAGRELLHRELGLELRHLGRGGIAGGDDGVEVRLRHDALAVQRGVALGLALGIGKPDTGGLERGLGDPDLLGAAPLLQVRELGVGLVAGGLRLGEGDLGVGALLAGDDDAGLDPVAHSHPHLLELGRGDGGEVDVLALDVADGEEVGRRAGEEAGDQRQRAEKASHAGPPVGVAGAGGSATPME